MEERKLCTSFNLCSKCIDTNHGGEKNKKCNCINKHEYLRKHKYNECIKFDDEQCCICSKIWDKKVTIQIFKTRIINSTRKLIEYKKILKTLESSDEIIK